MRHEESIEHTADRYRTRDLWVEARCVAITPLPLISRIGAEGIAPPSRWLQHRANLSQLNPSTDTPNHTDGGDRTRDLHDESVTCIPLHRARKSAIRMVQYPQRDSNSLTLIESQRSYPIDDGGLNGCPLLVTGCRLLVAGSRHDSTATHSIWIGAARFELASSCSQGRSSGRWLTPRNSALSNIRVIQFSASGIEIPAADHGNVF